MAKSIFSKKRFPYYEIEDVNLALLEPSAVFPTYYTDQFELNYRKNYCEDKRV